jgi:hypothetical protein
MTTVSKFPVGVAERLNWHSYRLIDPRNGETVHVGKGQRAGYISMASLRWRLAMAKIRPT